MAGIVEIEALLKTMSPEIWGDEYIFCTVSGEVADYVHLNPLATYAEAEGLTLILSVTNADKARIPYEGKYQQVTLNAHASLEAVGLTAAVSAKVTDHNIIATEVATYYHDQIFVSHD